MVKEKGYCYPLPLLISYFRTADRLQNLHSQVPVPEGTAT